MLSLISLGYLGLFIAAFLAATILPFSSEIIFSILIFNGLNPWLCVLVATLGNWLGGMTCFYIGWLGKIEWIEKYLKVKKDKLDRFSVTIQRYGNWIAFFTFLPGIGDFIAIASGFFKCKPWLVGTSMLLGKFIRYIVWMYLNGLFF